MSKHKPLDLSIEIPNNELANACVNMIIRGLTKDEKQVDTKGEAFDIVFDLLEEFRDELIQRFKSAVQGLLIDIEVTDLDEIVCSDGSHRRMDEKTRKRIITDLIKKWFPNILNEDL